MCLLFRCLSSSKLMKEVSIYGLMQMRCSSIANTLQLCLSCTKPSICDWQYKKKNLPQNICLPIGIPHVAKFMEPTWGPPGSCRPQMGLMLAQWTLLSRTTFTCTDGLPQSLGSPVMMSVDSIMACPRWPYIYISWHTSIPVEPWSSLCSSISHTERQETKAA